MLRQRYNEKHKRIEWALVARTGSKILQWFGTRKPNKARIDKAEARVQYYENKEQTEG